MPIAVHYALTVLIWGLTWTAIRFQVEVAPVDISVFYRFVLAALVTLAVLAMARRLTPLSLAQHRWLILQGLTLYSVNFLLIYRAAETMTSGLLAVVFSLAALFNAFNGWALLGARPTSRLYPALVLGVSGVALLFWHDLQLGNATGASILFALAGTFWFSLGNLVSVKVRAADVPLLTANAWAMVYGAVILGAWCLFQDVDWVLPASVTFWNATLFLAVPGSIVAFYCYITVIQTLGADRAGYATVLFPVVALTVSTWLEGFEWTTPAVLGAGMALLGNVILFRRG
ncbi:MAG TPA: DMT family transporter [Marinobacter sp.]|nr:DMT family transporter [Marinobacter sp.]